MFIIVFIYGFEKMMQLLAEHTLIDVIQRSQKFKKLNFLIFIQIYFFHYLVYIQILRAFFQDFSKFFFAYLPIFIYIKLMKYVNQLFFLFVPLFILNVKKSYDFLEFIFLIQSCQFFDYELLRDSIFFLMFFEPLMI